MLRDKKTQPTIVMSKEDSLERNPASGIPSLHGNLGNVLDELERLYHMATPGAWEAFISPNDGDGYRVCGVYSDRGRAEVVTQRPASELYTPDPAPDSPHFGYHLWQDMEFTAVAHNAIPALIAEIRGLRAAVEVCIHARQPRDQDARRHQAEIQHV